MLVRHDIDVESIGTMAVLLDDPTPLQIGTQGRFEKARFSLLGRLRLTWSDGNWNEWFALFDDMRHGWLAEAQGFYMLSFAAGRSAAPPDVSALSPEATLQIEGATYTVSEIKESTCTGSEGELPFAAPVGRRSVSVDLSGANGAFACIDYADGEVRVYTGRYVDFDELHLQQLRKLDGW